MAKPNPRQDEVLETAAQLFFERGFHGVGIRTIADAVGLQTSSLYHYFSSKEELLFRIVLQATNDFTTTHTEILRSASDRVEALKYVIRNHVTFFSEHHVAQRVAERESRELSAEHREEIRRQQRSYVDELTAFVAAGNAEGVLDVAHPAIATRAFLDMLNNFSRWFRARPSMTIADLADLYADMIVDGLLKARSLRGRPDRLSEGPDSVG